MGENYKLLENFDKTLEIFAENSIEKLNFYIFLGKVVATNRAFGNNIIFLQQFFSGSRGGLNPQPPCVRHCWAPNIGYHQKKEWDQMPNTAFAKCLLKIKKANSRDDLPVSTEISSLDKAGSFF